MERRKFLTSSAGALAGFRFGRLGGSEKSALANTVPSAAVPSNDQVGRPVRVVSIGFRNQTKSLEEIANVVDAEGSRGVDVIALPEAWRGQPKARDELWALLGTHAPRGVPVLTGPPLATFIVIISRTSY